MAKNLPKSSSSVKDVYILTLISTKEHPVNNLFFCQSMGHAIYVLLFFLRPLNICFVYFVCLSIQDFVCASLLTDFVILVNNYLDFNFLDSSVRK